MIPPIVCFTCGRPLGSLWDRYEELVKHYTQTPDPKSPSPIYSALADLKIGRVCCRTMMMTNQNMYRGIF